MRNFSFKRISAFLVLVLILPAVLAGPSCARAEEPLRIGVISGLTGAAAKWNRFQNMGMELAVEQLARDGVPVQLVFEDSQTQGVRAIAAFNKLVNLSKVDALIADDFGLVVAPLLPITKRQGKVLVSTGLPHEQFCAAGGDYFVTVASKIEGTKSAFEGFFQRHPEVKRIGLVVFDDPDWGNAYRAVWEEIARARGISIVETFLNNEWSPDFKSVMAKMMSKKPDAIFVAHEPESFVKAMRQVNFKGQVVIANCVLEMLADSDVSRPELEGIYTVDPRVTPEFVAVFKQRFHREPILEAYAGYEAVRAIVKAASIDRAGLHRGIRRVAYDGVAGRVDFTGPSCRGNNASWGLLRFKLREGKTVAVPVSEPVSDQ
jgi:branched-chain amino acid transport system substrate-binding protein